MKASFNLKLANGLPSLRLSLEYRTPSILALVLPLHFADGDSPVIDL